MEDPVGDGPSPPAKMCKAVLAEVEAETEADDFLCTNLCDLMLDLPPPPPSWQLWALLTSRKISEALLSCNEGQRDEYGEDTPTTDLRGHFADTVKELLITILNRCSFRPAAKYVNIRVGCKKHGVGRGKLRDMICDMLRGDPDIIEWNLRSDDSIISIKLDGRNDYSSLGWGLSKGTQTLTDVEHSEDQEGKPMFSPHVNASKKLPEAKIALEKKKKSPVARRKVKRELMADINPPRESYQSGKDGFLCTIACDFLFSLPKQCWEEGTTLKLLAGLGKCQKGVSDEDEKGSYSIDLRGRCADEAKKVLISQLNCQPDIQFLKVIVGCKLHGVGEGKLKDMVIDMLEHDQKVEWNFIEEVSIISIKLDGRKEYNSLDLDLGDRSEPPIDVDDFREYESSYYSGEDYGSELAPLPHRGGPSNPSEKGISETISPYSASQSHRSADLTTEVEEVDLDIDSLAEVYKSYMKVPLCTIICDFLSDLQIHLDQGWDEETNLKVLAGFEKCNEGASDTAMEGSYLIDIRGRYVEDAKKILMEHLHCQSGLSYLNVRVGCKVHGVGEGKLKDVVLQWLKHYQNIKVDFQKEVSIIHIKLDGPPEVENMSLEKKNVTISDFSKDFLCTTFCDLLLGLPSPPQSWQSSAMVAAYMKISAGLCSCNQGHRDRNREDTQTIDLRGLFADDAKELLLTTLKCFSLRPTARYVNVRVGCQEHGVGKGKLRDMICDMLKSDPEMIEWTLKSDDFIISIKLDGRSDYSSLGWGLSEGSQPTDSQKRTQKLNIEFYKKIEARGPFI